MTVLLDSSVLIPIAVDDHDHHDVAVDWWVAHKGRFATCPITEGALVRHVVRNGSTAKSAVDFVAAMTQSDRHEFWPDDVSWTDVAISDIVGHRQVTDAYLAQLTRRHNGRIATFDRGFASLHKDVADLIPTTRGDDR